MALPKSTESQQAYRTPRAFFDWVSKTRGPYTLDAAADAANALCALYFTAEVSGLTNTWGFENVWVNPPFKDVRLWLDKAVREAARGARVTMLLPAAFETAWFRSYAIHGRVSVLYPRLPYIHPDPAQRSAKSGPPLASMLVDFEATTLRAANDDGAPLVVPVNLLEIPADVMKAVRAELKGAA